MVLHVYSWTASKISHIQFWMAHCFRRTAAETSAPAASARKADEGPSASRMAATGRTAADAEKVPEGGKAARLQGELRCEKMGLGKESNGLRRQFQGNCLHNMWAWVLGQEQLLTPRHRWMRLTKNDGFRWISLVHWYHNFDQSPQRLTPWKDENWEDSILLTFDVNRKW